MIVDSSVLVAILRAEPEAHTFAMSLRDVRARISTGSVLETATVIGPDQAARLDTLIDELDLDVVAFDGVQLAAAREAMAAFGKGRGHRAQLNFGDCMSYALAKVTGEPLLFKGEDFTHTDITPAL